MNINYWYNYEKHQFEFDFPKPIPVAPTLFVVLPKSVKFLDSRSDSFKRAQDMLTAYQEKISRHCPNASFNLLNGPPTPTTTQEEQLSLL